MFNLLKFRTQRGKLMTLCDRKSRFVIIAPLKTKLAAETRNQLRTVSRYLPQQVRRTVTFDNGGTFCRIWKTVRWNWRSSLSLRSACAVAARHNRKRQWDKPPRHAEVFIENINVATEMWIQRVHRSNQLVDNKMGKKLFKCNRMRDQLLLRF